MTTKSKDILIIEASLKLFKTMGFAAVRIADIAKEAGVGKGTVYEYFSSKEELLVKACSLCCTQTGEEIEDILRKETELRHPVKIVHRTMEIVLTKLLSKSSEENKMLYELSVLAAGNQELKEMVREHFHAKLKQWQQFTLLDYQRGLDAGYFRFIKNPEDLAQFLVASVDGIIWQMQWQKNNGLQDNHATKMANVYCQLILAEPERLEEFIK